jgi:hypothetical protein
LKFISRVAKWARWIDCLPGALQVDDFPFPFSVHLSQHVRIYKLKFPSVAGGDLLRAPRSWTRAKSKRTFVQRALVIKDEWQPDYQKCIPDSVFANRLRPRALPAAGHINAKTLLAPAESHTPLQKLISTAIKCLVHENDENATVAWVDFVFMASLTSAGNARAN